MNMNMNDYRIAEYAGNSSVATAVTLLVSAWFLVAAGAILADPVSPYTQRPVAAQAAAGAPAVVAEAAPVAYFTITVEAKRLKV